jgi:hypothetical protein
MRLDRQLRETSLPGVAGANNINQALERMLRARGKLGGDRGDAALARLIDHSQNSSMSSATASPRTPVRAKCGDWTGDTPTSPRCESPGWLVPRHVGQESTRPSPDDNEIGITREDLQAVHHPQDPSRSRAAMICTPIGSGAIGTGTTHYRQANERYGLGEDPDVGPQRNFGSTDYSGLLTDARRRERRRWRQNGATVVLPAAMAAAILSADSHACMLVRPRRWRRVRPRPGARNRPPSPPHAASPAGWPGGSLSTQARSRGRAAVASMNLSNVSLSISGICTTRCAFGSQSQTLLLDGHPSRYSRQALMHVSILDPKHRPVDVLLVARIASTVMIVWCLGDLWLATLPA